MIRDQYPGLFAELGSDLARTLVVVISKSGSTKETRNGMLEAQTAYRAAGLDFARYAVAVTGFGSDLDGALAAAFVNCVVDDTEPPKKPVKKKVTKPKTPAATDAPPSAAPPK